MSRSPAVRWIFPACRLAIPPALTITPRDLRRAARHSRFTATYQPRSTHCCALRPQSVPISPRAVGDNCLAGSERSSKAFKRASVTEVGAGCRRFNLQTSNGGSNWIRRKARQSSNLRAILAKRRSLRRLFSGLPVHRATGVVAAASTRRLPSHARHRHLDRAKFDEIPERT